MLYLTSPIQIKIVMAINNGVEMKIKALLLVFTLYNS